MDTNTEPKSIDEYLDQVFVGRKGVSVYEAKEVREELRRHLEALIAAAEFSGSSSEEALRTAIQKFGAPNVIRHMLERQWKQQTNTRPWTKWGKLLIQSVVFAVLLNVLTPKSALLALGANATWLSSVLFGMTLGFSMAFSMVFSESVLDWKYLYQPSLLDLPNPLHQYSPKELEQIYNDRLEYRANPNARKDMVEFFERARYPLRAIDRGFFTRSLCWLAVASLLPPSELRTWGLVIAASNFTMTITQACMRQLQIMWILAR